MSDNEMQIMWGGEMLGSDESCLVHCMHLRARQERRNGKNGRRE